VFLRHPFYSVVRGMITLLFYQSPISCHPGPRSGICCTILLKPRNRNSGLFALKENLAGLMYHAVVLFVWTRPDGGLKNFQKTTACESRNGSDLCAGPNSMVHYVICLYQRLHRYELLDRRPLVCTQYSNGGWKEQRGQLHVERVDKSFMTEAGSGVQLPHSTNCSQ